MAKKNNLKKAGLIGMVAGAILMFFGWLFFGMPRTSFFGGLYQDVLVAGLVFIVVGLVMVIWKKRIS